MDDKKKRIITAEMSKGLKKAVKILKEQGPADLDNPLSPIRTKLREVWEQAILNVWNGLGRNNLAAAWLATDSQTKEELTRNKSMSFKNFLGQAIEHLDRGP